MQITRPLRRLHLQRGQALAETAVALPVFLLVLWGIIWAVQASVTNERVQVAVRYAGLVSNQTAPYMSYSLYALYDNLEGIASPPSFSCVAPTTDALLNNGQFPGPTTFPLWNPGTTNGTCSMGEVSLQDATLLQPQIFTHTLSSITTSTPISGVLTATMGSVQNLAGQENELEAPVMGSMLYCYQELDNAVSSSLSNTTPATTVTTVTPLPAINPTNSLVLNNGC